jgi:hypothetical protein
MLQQIRGGSQVTGQQFAPVIESDAHVVGKAAQEEHVEEDVRVLWKETLHLCEERGWAAITEGRQIQEAETSLEWQHRETGEEGFFEQKIRLRRGGGDVSGQITDGSEHVRRQGACNVHVTHIEWAGRRTSVNSASAC